MTAGRNRPPPRWRGFGKRVKPKEEPRRGPSCLKYGETLWKQHEYLVGFGRRAQGLTLFRPAPFSAGATRPGVQSVRIEPASELESLLLPGQPDSSSNW